MSGPSAPFCTNKLLCVLSPEDRELMRSHLEPVELEHDIAIELPGELVRHVYFIESGIASAVGSAHGSHDDRPIEIAIIGREGMTGIAVILGDNQALTAITMQVAGRAQRMAAQELRVVMQASLTLHALLLRFVQVFLTQIGQTAVANGRSKLEERLARWPLMVDDRLDGSELPLTQGLIAMMLGVRRADVTDAIHALAGRGLVKAKRGALRIIDRAGLEVSANSCYGAPESEYRRLIGGGEHAISAAR